MSQPAIETAVILAAGMGTRLRDEVSDRPKGLICLGDRPIVEESMMRLRAAGIARILLVTGHQAERYEPLVQAWGDRCETVHNPRFASSGSMYSLYCAREQISSDFLLLESDLVYESRALTRLLNCPDQDAILLSGPTEAGDEVYVHAQAGRLVSMSKDRSALGGPVAGELVGISKISRELFDLMSELAAQAFETSLAYDYETDCLVAAAAQRPIGCPLVPDLRWGEIDDPAHLARVREKV